MKCHKCSWEESIPATVKVGDKIKAVCPICGAYLKWLTKVDAINFAKKQMKQDQGFKPAFCPHTNLVPHTVIAGKQTWDKNQSFIDWSSNIINAHYLRVVKYYCPGCNQLIDAPKEATDAKE